jgi:hypothetical protein
VGAKLIKAAHVDTLIPEIVLVADVEPVQAVVTGPPYIEDYVWHITKNVKQYRPPGAQISTTALKLSKLLGLSIALKRRQAYPKLEYEALASTAADAPTVKALATL